MSDVITKYHYDHLEDRLIVQTVQDVEPIIEANKRQYEVDNKRFKHETFNHVARIPEALALKWCNDKGIKYSEFLSNPAVIRLFVNDPDNKFCRTKPGRV